MLAQRPSGGRRKFLLAFHRRFGSILPNQSLILALPRSAGPERATAGSHLQSELAMSFEPSAKVQDLQKRVSAFMAEHVYPNEKAHHAQIQQGNRWQPTAILE